MKLTGVLCALPGCRNEPKYLAIDGNGGGASGVKEVGFYGVYSFVSVEFTIKTHGEEFISPDLVPSISRADPSHTK